jgi:hypothetical protein
MIKDPFEFLDHEKGYSNFGDYLNSLPTQEEKDHAIEQLRVFLEEPGGPYDYDAIFAQIPEENIKEYLRGWGLLPKDSERVASGVSTDGSDLEGM